MRYTVSARQLPPPSRMFPLPDPAIRFVSRLSHRNPTHHPTEVTLTGTLTHPTPTYFTNDGQRDMATSTPSQFLLFRNLEAGVNEDILSKGVYKLSSASSPAGAAESSIRRVLLVRDRRTNESWRFGFAEFSTPQEAQKALKVYEGLEKFTISSKPVSVSYIHPGVFVPVYNASDEAERFTFLPLMPVGGGMRLAYWDEEAYVSELVLNTSPEPSSGGEADKPKDEKKSKKRKAEPIAAEKAKKSAVPAPHLQFWQNRHSELHGVKPKPIIQPEESSADNSAPEVVAASVPVLPVQPTDDFSRTESFADMNKLACLLCSRQFKTAEKLHQHERVSPLHADNLKKPELVETARKKLPKKNDEYRDRAKERREAFGPGTAPAPSQKKKQREKSPVKEVTEPVASKGAALLGKMGWSAGQGLGATGEGRTEHVVAEMYTAGVGLGMKGAKVGDVEEVAKAGSGGYGDFVRRTKERAKERYEEMG
jgi:RNA-binding protein 5/10